MQLLNARINTSIYNVIVERLMAYISIGACAVVFSCYSSSLACSTLICVVDVLQQPVAFHILEQVAQSPLRVQHFDML